MNTYLDPKLVNDLYIKHGREPDVEVFQSSEKACLSGILRLEAEIDRIGPTTDKVCEHFNFSRIYFLGLITGFIGKDRCAKDKDYQKLCDKLLNLDPDKQKEYEFGYLNGVDCFLEVIKNR